MAARSKLGGARRRRGRTPGGLPRALAGVLRALAVCLALSLSGLVHFALDLWLDGQAAAAHFAGCPEDEEGGDCPPGCVSCHCTHASPALPTPFQASAPSVLLPLLMLTWSPHHGGAPPSPPRAAVYRPPRA